MGGNSNKGRYEIQITNVDPKIKKDLKVIAKKEETTLSQLLKPYLRKIRDKHSFHLIDEN